MGIIRKKMLSLRHEKEIKMRIGENKHFFLMVRLKNLFEPKRLMAI